MFSRLKEYIPFVAPIIIALGIIKQMFYYHAFNIQILNFLEVGEVLILFMSDALLLLLFIVPPMIMLLVADFQVTKQTTLFGESQTMLDLLFKFFSLLGILLFLYSATMMIVYWNNYFEKTLFGLVLAVSILLMYVYRLSLHAANETAKKILLTIVVFGFIVHQVLVNTNKEARRAYNGRYIGTIIKTKDSTYISDPTTFYVGKTKEYSFLYNKKKNSAIIIPNGEIEKMVYKTKLYD